MIGLKEMVLSGTRGALDRILGRISSHRGYSNIGTAAHGNGDEWKYLRDMSMWDKGTWFNGETH